MSISKREITYMDIIFLINFVALSLMHIPLQYDAVDCDMQLHYPIKFAIIKALEMCSSTC